jgi:hypothetical protein
LHHTINHIVKAKEIEIIYQKDIDPSNCNNLKLPEYTSPNIEFNAINVENVSDNGINKISVMSLKECAAPKSVTIFKTNIIRKNWKKKSLYLYETTVLTIPSQFMRYIRVILSK